MYYHTTQSGYSMVEVLVAISILLLATVGPMTIAARSLQYAEYSSQQNTAYFLAQEAIEAVMMVRAETGLAAISGSGAAWDWTTGAGDLASCFDADGCGIDWREAGTIVRVTDCDPLTSCRIYYNDGAGRARYSHDSAGIETPFTRAMYLNTRGGDQVEIEVEVRWLARATGDPQTLTLKTYVHNIYDFTP